MTMSAPPTTAKKTGADGPLPLALPSDRNLYVDLNEVERNGLPPGLMTPTAGQKLYPYAHDAPDSELSVDKMPTSAFFFPPPSPERRYCCGRLSRRGCLWAIAAAVLLVIVAVAAAVVCVFILEPGGSSSSPVAVTETTAAAAPTPTPAPEADTASPAPAQIPQENPDGPYGWPGTCLAATVESGCTACKVGYTVVEGVCQLGITMRVMGLAPCL